MDGTDRFGALRSVMYGTDLNWSEIVDRTSTVPKPIRSENSAGSNNTGLFKIFQE
jgi:hypothetical protein